MCIEMILVIYLRGVCIYFEMILVVYLKGVIIYVEMVLIIYLSCMTTCTNIFIFWELMSVVLMSKIVVIIALDKMDLFWC